MHIGIDARFYGPAQKGLGRYVQKLITYLEKLDSEHTFTVLMRSENWNEYAPENPRFRKALADIPWYSVHEQLQLPRLLRSHHFDLIHFPHYNVPLLYRQPFIVTIHDLIVSRFPTRRASTLGPIKYWAKQKAYLAVIRSAVHRAKAILTVSEFSKREVLSAYHVPPEKITVTYEAVDPMPTPTDAAAVVARYRLERPYLLYVGNAYPHKNLERLLTVFVRLREHRPDLQLLLVGKIEYFYARLQARAKELGIADAVLFTGYVPDEALGVLYAHAMLYVFPSIDEGFGLPPLEAMQGGAAVASSNTSCMPEVLGEAASFFRPDDERDMLHVISRLLDHPEERAALRERGYEQVHRYSWDSLARTTLDVYTACTKPKK